MSENKQALKMCPFCGADAKLEQPRNRAGVSCTECGCRTPLMLSVADALSIWNERPAVLSASAGEKKDAKWLPIETAPVDELILVGPTKRMGICVAMNHSRDGWVTESCSDWHNIYTPTHWMPLPPAPIRATNSMQSTKEEK